MLACVQVAAALLLMAAVPMSRSDFRREVATAGRRASAVSRGLASEDAAIRRYALWCLYSDSPAKAFDWMDAHVGDGSREVGLLMAELSRQMPEKRRLAFLGKLAAIVTDERVSKAVSAAIGFPFFRNNVAVSQDPVNDHPTVLVKAFPLPDAGWRFRHDVKAEGHRAPCYQNPKVQPTACWPEVSIGKFWEDCPGVGRSYDGIGWYRLEWTVPEKPNGANVVELCFDGVDEEAWVWLNGEYVGQHTEGPGGWNKPFRFDVAKELKWGERNVLVVRVSDTANFGGIHKGVRLEAMKCDF